VSLGDLTKQLAKEALGAQVDEMIDTLRGPEAAAKAEALTLQGGPAAGPGEPLAIVMIGQVQAMQNALKEDQELLVLWSAGQETIRIFEMFAPSPRLLVLSGIDTARALTRVVTSVESLQLICKPAAVKDGSKPVRLRFVGPKAKGG
jgi:hypothetical protein